MHDQRDYSVRFEWGPTGAAAVVADVCVVVDVLSFTTTTCVAVERGIAVLPFRWRDERAAAYAEERAATLAVGRLEARAAGAGVSLSPAAMAAVAGVERIVLPSPNGSSIAFALADSGAEVVAGCLRNRTAVAALLRTRLDAGRSVALVAAGERWPDDSLRPAAEDLWGAGAVLSALGASTAYSPEARLAARSFDAVAPTLAAELRDCAGGRELAEAGFAEDVEVAAAVDVTDVVPVLADRAFSAR